MAFNLTNGLQLSGLSGLGTRITTFPAAGGGFILPGPNGSNPETASLNDPFRERGSMGILGTGPYDKALAEYQKGNYKVALTILQDSPVGSKLKGTKLWTDAMAKLSAATPDPFDTMIKQASMAQIERVKGGSRQQSFVTGPRGLEGPMANMIFGGGTSLLGS